jgi:hypothetical protein
MSALTRMAHKVCRDCKHSRCEATDTSTERLVVYGEASGVYWCEAPKSGYLPRRRPYGIAHNHNSCGYERMHGGCGITAENFEAKQ